MTVLCPQLNKQNKQAQHILDALGIRLYDFCTWIFIASDNIKSQN